MGVPSWGVSAGKVLAVDQGARYVMLFPAVHSFHCTLTRPVLPDASAAEPGHCPPLLRNPAAANTAS